MAGIYNFTIDQGADFTRSIVWNDANGDPVDLTGYSAQLIAKVRRSDTAPVLNLTDADDISLGTTNGTITITLTETQTEALDFRFAIYDLFLNDVLLFSGEITLNKTTRNG